MISVVSRMLADKDAELKKYGKLKCRGERFARLEYVNCVGLRTPSGAATLADKYRKTTQKGAARE